MFRIGNGFDIHRLQIGRPLILGGIKIPHFQGLAGHSDADGLTHAIIDSFLGALALGDIGLHFPDTDSRYKDISSLKLLKEVHQKIQNHGYGLQNLDSTIIAQSPKLTSHIAKMRQKLAETLDCSPDKISIKATTGEHIGFIGRNEGMAFLVTSILQESQNPACRN